MYTQDNIDLSHKRLPDFNRQGLSYRYPLQQCTAHDFWIRTLEIANDGLQRRSSKQPFHVDYNIIMSPFCCLTWFQIFQTVSLKFANSKRGKQLRKMHMMFWSSFSRVLDLGGGIDWNKNMLLLIEVCILVTTTQAPCFWSIYWYYLGYFFSFSFFLMQCFR